MGRVLVGITTDVVEAGGREKADVSLAYARCVAQSGGVPVLLPAIAAMVGEHVACCDAFVLTGGDDPRMEEFGVGTHAAARLVHPVRQEYELALLRALERTRPNAPVLGVCLGMQFMGLAARGTLHQHLPEVMATHADHKNGAHEVGLLACPAWSEARARVWSNHHQALSSSGSLRVVARSDDGVIEGVQDPDRAFYLGVQWHPERTGDDNVGAGLFAQLVRAASESK